MNTKILFHCSINTLSPDAIFTIIHVPQFSMFIPTTALLCSCWKKHCKTGWHHVANSVTKQLFDSLCNYLQDSNEPVAFQLTLVRNTSSTLLRRYKTLQMWGMKLSCGLHIPWHTATFHTLQHKGLAITYWKTWILNHTTVKPKTLQGFHFIRLPLSLAPSHTTIQVHALHIKSK
jgi:hypothetical protein